MYIFTLKIDEQTLPQLKPKIPYTILRRYALWQIKRHGFWFIDVPRTSSSSIKVELGEIFGATFGKSQVPHSLYTYPQFFRDHIPAIVFKDMLGHKVWNRLYTFAMTRNPWDRMVSSFLYRKSVNDLPKKVTFVEYISWFDHPQYGLKNSPHAYYVHYYSTADYICDEEGKIIVTAVGKFEEREEFLKKVGSKIGVQLGTLHLQQSYDRKPYQYYYSKETQEIVARFFKKDIALFDYKFE